MAQETKPFRTFDEQIEILEDRRLIIEDKEYSKEILSNVNYYRWSGYTLELRREDKFNKGVRFEDTMPPYYFDMELRSLLMYPLDEIEIAMRTHIGYYHAKEYGALGYKKADAFEDEDSFNSFTERYQKDIEQRERIEDFVRHHIENYNGQFPIWALVEVLSFGTLAHLFKNMRNRVSKTILKEYYNGMKESDMEKILFCLADLRNICAHQGRLYERELPDTIPLNNKSNKIFKKSGIPEKQAGKQLFAYLLTMKRMVADKKVWETFWERLKNLHEKYPEVDLSKYGFVDGWEEHLKWEDTKGDAAVE